MRKGLSRVALLAVAVLLAGVSSATEEVLYWMVDGDDKVTRLSDGSNVKVSEFFADPGEGSAFAARVRVTGGNIQDGEDVFLDLYIPGSGVDVGGGEYGVELGSAGGYWGAGVPTGNQSPSGDYSAGSPEYSFVIEIGNVDAQDNWTTVAWSAAATYSSLGSYIHETFDLNPSSLEVWQTQFNTVPEPSGGLLFIVGGALLALRRKRREGE